MDVLAPGVGGATAICSVGPDATEDAGRTETGRSVTWISLLVGAGCARISCCRNRTPERSFNACARGCSSIDGASAESEAAPTSTVAVTPDLGVVSASLAPIVSLAGFESAIAREVATVLAEVSFVASSGSLAACFPEACLAPRLAVGVSALVLNRADVEGVRLSAARDRGPGAELRDEGAAGPRSASVSGPAASLECALVESAGAAAATP